MNLTFVRPAGPGSVYAPDAFADQVGHPIQINVLNVATEGVLTEAVVADDGLSVTLTIDVTDTLLGLIKTPMSGYSIAQDPRG